MINLFKIVAKIFQKTLNDNNIIKQNLNYIIIIKNIYNTAFDGLK